MTSVKDRFESFIFYGLDGCWYWLGSISTNGYGRFMMDNKNRAASRVSYKLYKKDPKKMHVCHTCDNRMCVNPDHLFLGTNQDNVDDMMSKNRQFKKAFCKHGHPLIDPNLVYLLRKGKPYRLCKACYKRRIIEKRVSRNNSVRV